MVTPDPRRGDEPGDPDITPGQPRRDGETAPEAPRPSDGDEQRAATGSTPLS